MKPTIKLSSAKTPDGSETDLYQHDKDYFITVNREQLMSSREHESELELARLACERLADRREPTVLIGGLGMGYTLRQALDILPPKAKIIVAELMPEIVRWNRDIIGHLTNHPLRDKRVTVKTVDVALVMAKAPHQFDAVMLDVDNGPEAMTDSSNTRLYSRGGIQGCFRSLHAKGCLAVWSASKDISYEKRLRREKLHVRAFHVAKCKGGKSCPRCIWVASNTRSSLPEYPEPRFSRD
jgi:spermidine synthase